MYENFLNSTSFEQMAREYNAKYNRVNFLQTGKDDLMLQVKEVLKDLDTLVNSISNCYKNNFLVKTQVESLMNVNENAKNFFVNVFGKPITSKQEGSFNKNQVNNKYCSCKMLSMYSKVLEINKKYLSKICKNDVATYQQNEVSTMLNSEAISQLNTIIHSVTTTLKDFYEKM